MFMELCSKWIDSNSKEKFGQLSRREEAVVLEFAAWLNQVGAEAKTSRERYRELVEALEHYSKAKT